MTDLGRLKVSLTKHNAHKVARLLKEYPASEVFDRLNEVHAEPAQARKNLSTLQGDVLPPVWADVQALGDDAIDALVLIAIIFSHRELIDAMSGASKRAGLAGRIERNRQLLGKPTLTSLGSSISSAMQPGSSSRAYRLTFERCSRYRDWGPSSASCSN